jgi:tetratricopeptide (TPR) repeat protein
MRLRTALLAFVISCGQTERETAAPTPPPVSQPVVIAPTVVQHAGVTLPEIAVQSIPLDQVAAPFSLTASDGTGLLATRIDAKAVVQGPLAFTELHLYFANTENRVREGTFAITLPAGAAVSRFAMMGDDGKWMEAEVVEKQLARRAYEDFLHRKQDPALMEKAAGNQFTARVFPIPAKGVKHLVLSFSQELPGERYVLPLRGLPKVGQLDVELAVTGVDGARAKQELKKRDWQPEHDFVSTAPTAAEAIASGELVVAQVSPFDQATVAKDVPSAMTLLVDTSASRALGFARYASNVNELVSSLAAKYPGLAIEVIAFDQDTQSIYAGPASGFGAAQIEAIVKRGAAGASDVGQALDKIQPKARVAIITDGVVTAGSNELPSKIKALADKQVERVDVVMVGGIRDQALASSLVTAGLPRTGAVLDLDQRMGEVANGLGERVLTDIQVEVAGATWVYPKTIKSARPNQRTMIYARFEKPQQTIDVKIHQSRRKIGTVGGTPALVERAAAAAEISDLEAKLDGAEDKKAARAEIVKKAVAARVISNHTSMLVLESDGDYARFGIDRNALADILVVGPDGVEQKNRTFVATKRRPQRVEKQQEQREIALKDTTDPNAPVAVRVAGGAAGGVEGGVMGGVVAGEAYRVAVESPMSPPPAPMPEPAKVVAPEMKKESESVNDEKPKADPAPSDALVEDDFVSRQPPPARWSPPSGAPPALKGKLAQIDRLLRRGKIDDALAIAQPWHDEKPGDVLALVGLGEVLEAKKDLAQAARMYGSIIDLFPGRADLRRFAGERLERVGESARALAVDTYRRAVEERPDHLSGHRLLAYALLRNGQHAEALDAILRGIKQKYPDDRFAGGMRVLVEDAGLIAAAYVAAHPDKKADIVAALKKHKATLSTRASTRFIMYWETDANDVDFHIQDAQGGHAYYGQRELASGGELYADITTGYGPECFTIPGRAKAGPYKLSINYYSQGPMGYGMGLLQIIKHDGKGQLEFQDRPYVIMNDEAYLNLGSFR